MATYVQNKKIGVMTMHCVPNYGAIFQAYATVEMFRTRAEKLNMSTQIEIVDYQPLNKKIKYSNVALLQYVLRNPLQLKRLSLLAQKGRHKSKKLHDAAYEFYKKSAIISNEYTNKQLGQLNEHYNALIVGSDQVWNPYGMDRNNEFLLGFTDNNYKFSFSSSFGIKEFPDEYKDTYKNELGKFKLLSVREKEGIDIVKELTGRSDCIQTIDPTLLLDKSDYRRFEGSKVEKKFQNDYILVYLAMKTDTLMEIVEKHTTGNQKIIVTGMPDVISEIKFDDERIIVLNDIKPEQFLELFDHAKLIYTNSFHGVAFSIIYEKQVFIEYNDKFSKSNSRLENIVKAFKLQDRVIDIEQELDSVESIDYKEVNETRKELKRMSIDYIDKILIEISGGGTPMVP